MRRMIRKPAWICLFLATLAVPWAVAGCPKPGPQPLAGDYVGDGPCAQCHANIHANWSATLHAHAIEALLSVGQADNANCQPCHTTGFGEPGGFVNRAATPQLAGVQCEACHGPAGPHVRNVTDVSLRPVVSVASDVCGGCHGIDTYPQYPQWLKSAHATVTGVPAQDFTEGRLLSTCGPCHSGDYRSLAILRGKTVSPTLLQGVPQSKQNAVTCDICHDPHARTGNAVDPDDGRDFQLRYPEAVSPPPSNSLAVLTDENRYNLCGHCHRTRTAVWTSTDRGPHESVQANIYIGEMPMPPGQENTPLVANMRSAHRFVPGQCATCHMSRAPSPGPFAPPISLHTMEVNMATCSDASGCHPSPEIAETDRTALQTEVHTRLEEIASRLGPISGWGYSAEGGPSNQAALSDAVKQIRFLYFYVLNDGSLGVHNPAYVRAMLTQAENLLTGLGK